MYKSINKKLISSLPEKLRKYIIQQRIKINYNLPKDYSFKLASTKSDFKAVGELVHKRYIDAGLQENTNTDSRLSIYQGLPNTAVLMMLKADKLIGTVTLIGDSTLGLPSEKLVDIQDLKKKKRCCEVSALAICKEEKGKFLLYLFKYLYQVAHEIMRVEYLVISTTKNSHTSKVVYNSILQFDDVEDTKKEVYEDANGQKCVTQVLKVSTARHYYKAIYGKNKKENNLYYFFVKHKVDQFNLNYKIDMPNPITLEAAFESILMNDFVQKQLTVELRQKLFSMYNGSPYEKKINDFISSDNNNFSKRQDQRLPCYDECILFFKEKYYKTTLLNSSTGGLLIKLKVNTLELQDGASLEILWLQNNGEYHHKDVRVVWKEEYLIGIKFL